MVLFRRAARVLAEHPSASDAGLAAVLAALALSDVFISGGYLTGSRWVYVSAGLTMTAPLAWRRRAPLLVALLVMGAFATQSLILDPTPTPDVELVPSLLAVYSVAAHGERWVPFAGGGVGLAGGLIWLGVDDFLLPVVLFGGAWLAGRLVQKRQLYARVLAHRADALEREREENARLAVAEERSRIARELHDIVAHGVSVMVVNAGAERLSLEPGQESTREVLRSIEEAGREALGDMGRLVTVLRGAEAASADELDPQPGLARLGALADRVRAAGLEVDVVVEGEPRRLAPGLDVSAYRIIQEGLTNAIRHAHGSRARVRLAYGARELEIDVADDGLGPGANGRGSGHGLVGIQERATLFGGRLETGRSDLGGYRLSIRLPLTT